MPTTRQLRLSWEGLSDEEIVSRVRKGEVELFEALMRRYNQRLFRVARSVLGDSHEAEDVMQETYVRAFARLDQLRDHAKLPIWLTRIALHEARLRSRKKARQVGLEIDFDNVVELKGRRLAAMRARAGTPEQQAGNAELRALLTAAIDRLSENLRLAFVLRDVEGLSTADAAASLGITTHSFRVRLHRARAALRQDLARRLGAMGPELLAFHAPRCDLVVAAVEQRITSERNRNGKQTGNLPFSDSPREEGHGRFATPASHAHAPTRAAPADPAGVPACGDSQRSSAGADRLPRSHEPSGRESN